MNPLQLIPAPYRLVAGAVSIALIVAVIFAFGWSKGAGHVQANWNAATAKAMAAQLVAEQTARQREQSMIDQLRKAENDAREREAKMRADFDAVRRSNLGLRDTIGTLRNGLPTDSVDACRATADAALAIFGECSDQLGELAVKADGHASDTQTLIDAWPK